MSENKNSLKRNIMLYYKVTKIATGEVVEVIRCEFWGIILNYSGKKYHHKEYEIENTTKRDFVKYRDKRKIL